MLKKFLLGFAIAGGLIVSAPTASAEPDPRCLAHYGCFWNGEEWVCSTPDIYLLCDLG